MITILLHKLELNEKRCLLNKSCSILCPNDGNISLVYGGSFVGYLQRDNCGRSVNVKNNCLQVDLEGKERSHKGASPPTVIRLQSEPKN